MLLHRRWLAHASTSCSTASWVIGVALGVGVAVAATVGDLMESLIKRDLGIKDMSNVLPGHGGVMDRLDSLVVVAPIVWAVLTLLAAKPA